MADMPGSRRVIAYVDGFNLYFGLREKRWRRYYWLNVQALVQSLLKPDQVLVCTKYFTARISGARRGDAPTIAKEREAKRQRQCNFLDALGTLSDFHIYEGHYLAKTIRCFRCNRSWEKPEEKMTDVQIATELLTDAFENRFDTALLISGDSDLVPPIRSIRSLFINKEVIVVFPPERTSEQLRRHASASFIVGKANLRKSQFPEKVILPNGFVLHRPARWK
jgi:uncharacterized LabA/DUF88 family protein